MNAHLTRGAVITAAVAAVLYLGFSLYVGWRGVVAAFAAAGAPMLIAALLLSLVNYGLRILRWRLYLAALGQPLSFRPAVATYLAGFAFTATPGKAGELLRGVFLKQRGAPYATSAAAFLSERLADLIAVLAIALPGAAAYPRGWLIIGLGLAMIGAVGAALSHLGWLALVDPWLRWAGPRVAAKLSALERLLLEARRCHEPRTLTIGLALSFAAWCAEALAFYLVLQRMGADIGLGFAMSVYALAMLAGAVSFLPGGLGGAEAVMMGLLVLVGVAEPTAVAATLLIRLTTLWFAVALGVAVLALERRQLWPEGEAAKT